MKIVSVLNGLRSKIPCRKRPRDFILYFQVDLAQEILVACGLLIALIIFRFDAISKLSTHFLGGYEHDAGLYVYLIKHNVRQLSSFIQSTIELITFGVYHSPHDTVGNLPWFDLPGFYPYGDSLAWSDCFIAPALVVYVLLKLGFSLTVSYNLLLLSACYLNGFLTYRLCYRLLGSGWPSFLAGLALMTDPFLSGNIGHPQLQFAFFIPLTLSILFRFFSSPNTFSAICIGISISIAFLTAVYYAIFTLLACAFSFLILMVLRPGYYSSKEIRTLFVGVILGMLPLLLVLGPYFDTKATFGSRQLYEAYYFSSSILGFFSTSAFNWIFGFTSNWCPSESHLFPGFTLLSLSILAIPRAFQSSRFTSSKYLILAGALLIAGLSFSTAPDHILAFKFWGGSLIAAIVMWMLIGLLLHHFYQLGVLERKLKTEIVTNRCLIAIATGLVIFFAAICFGPLGNPSNSEFALGFHRLLYSLLPGFDSLRAVSRAAIGVHIGLAVLCALSLQYFAQERRWQPHLFVIIAIAIMVENFNPTYPLETKVPKPQLITYLNSVSEKSDIAIVLPLASQINKYGQVRSWTEYARLNVNYMNWFFDFPGRIVNGYSGQRSKITNEYPRKMSKFPDDRSIYTLERITGIRYIFLASRFIPKFKHEEFRTALKKRSELKLIADDRDGNYLIEFVGESKIRERAKGEKASVLLYPPNHANSSVLYIELMVPYSKQTFDVEVDFYLNDDKQPFSQSIVASDGKWQRYAITIPALQNNVQPAKITFGLKFNLKEGEDLESFLKTRSLNPKSEIQAFYRNTKVG